MRNLTVTEQMLTDGVPVNEITLYVNVYAKKLEDGTYKVTTFAVQQQELAIIQAKAVRQTKCIVMARPVTVLV